MTRKEIYFKNPQHFFNYIKKILAVQMDLTEEDFMEYRDLVYYCKNLYVLTENNIEKINKLGLYTPMQSYGYQLKRREEGCSSWDTYSIYNEIYTDYREMLSMDKETLRKSEHYLDNYVEDRRVLVEYPRKTSIVIPKGIENTEMHKKLEVVADKSGVYKLFDENFNCIYVGKSYYLGSRVLTSAKERRAKYYSYGVVENKADTDIYEVYYINKLQPEANVASKSGEQPTITLPELTFIDPVEIHHAIYRG